MAITRNVRALVLPASLVVAIASIYEFSLSESNVLESVVIEKYFHLGYDNETITDLPQVYHIITMSVCTLTRRLQSYNLVKKAKSRYYIISI